MSEELPQYKTEKFYKVTVSPFTKADAQLVVNYLRAFSNNKSVELEGIEP